MKTLKIILLVPLSFCFIITACSDFNMNAEEDSIASQTEMTDVSADNSSANGATVNRQTFTVPFPPIPGVDYAPVPAPCLELGEPLRMSGIWTGWFEVVTIPSGRLHVTEQIDYSQITLKTDDLTWVAGPGAKEAIIQNLPLTPQDIGDAAYNVIHEFHARFISQNNGPDLHVSHRVRQLLGPDGVLRKNEFVPFTATCIGK